MAIDFPTSPTVGQTYTFGGVTYVFTAQGVWATAGASAIAVIGGSPQGRLTLQTATPVMTTTQSAKTTIYYSPYIGGMLPIYDGGSMVMTAFGELSVATTDTAKSPAAIGASKVNDWFVWSDAGTVRVGHGPDWTNDTTRSAGTALVMVNGIWLNNAAITNGPAAQRGTYVGTTRSNASSQLDWIYGTTGSGVSGVAGFFGVWNTYNRCLFTSVTGEGTASWTYATAAWRQTNGSATNQCSIVFGLQEDAANALASCYVGSAASVMSVGIGFNTTTARSGFVGNNPIGTSTSLVLNAGYGTAWLGFRFLAAIEQADGGTTGTYVGQAGTNGSRQQALITTFMG